jgi:hypothetical protein
LGRKRERGRGRKRGRGRGRKKRGIEEDKGGEGGWTTSTNDAEYCPIDGSVLALCLGESKGNYISLHQLREA